MSNIPDNPFLIQTEIFPEDPKELLIRLTQIYQDTSTKVNLREISNYTFTENPNGQQFPGVPPPAGFGSVLNPRNGYRKIISLTALVVGPNAFLHGIPYQVINTLRFTRISGVIENLAAQSYQPIPNDDIHLEVVGVNVVVTIPAAYVGFTGTVYLDYTQTD